MSIAAETHYQPSTPSETASRNHATVDILGQPISAITMDEALHILERWVNRRASQFVAVCDVHSLMRAVDSTQHADALRQAGMVVADGKPVALVGRLKGHREMRQVCGPELMLKVMAQSAEKGWTHYFYGGAEGVADDLAERMRAAYPGVNIVGTECPPFRALTPDEKRTAAQRIQATGAHFVWVGLGCPKQEQWMLENTHRLPGQILIGVGAAFDFHTGRVSRAPKWLRDAGLEWLHRLASNPRRLWRRYCVLAPRFVLANLAGAVAPGQPQRA